MRVGTVEHSHVAIALAGKLHLLHAVAYPGGLFPLVAGAEELDGFAGGLLGPQGLFHAAFVVGDYLIRRIKDVGGAAVVLLQLDDGGVGEILFKIENVADIRTAPAVDALIVIAHDAKVAALLRKELYQRILGKVGILVFVHVHIAKALAVTLQHGRMVGEQLQRPNQQIVKIQGVAMAQPALVGIIKVMNLLASKILSGGLEPFVGTEQMVLGVADFGLDLAQGQGFIVDTELLEQLLEHAGLIVIVVDGKGAGVAQFFDVPPQNAGAHGMEGADPYLAAAFTHQGAHALTHLFGGLVGKGNGQNIPRRHAVVDQIGNAISERACFAAARACQNKHRPFQGFCGLALLPVQSFQIHAMLSSIFTSVVLQAGPAPRCSRPPRIAGPG